MNRTEIACNASAIREALRDGYEVIGMIGSFNGIRFVLNVVSGAVNVFVAGMWQGELNGETLAKWGCSKVYACK